MDRLKRPRADRDQDCAPLLADLSPMQLEEFDGNEWVETPVQPLDNLTVETMWTRPTPSIRNEPQAPS